MILQVQEISKSFGGNVLFDKVSFMVNETDRYALVGPNGAGKTTMLRIIAGIDQADSGQVVVSKGCSVGYMEQESIELGKGVPVLDEVLTGVQDVLDLGEKMTELEERISVCTDKEEQEKLFAAYSRTSEAYERGGGYTIEPQARSILMGLGFSESDFSKDCDEFSGGWQMRIALAKLLMRHVDLLLLDEPTNHLDLESVRWLESYLRTYDGAVIVVSHDRDFMDGMVDHILELDMAQFTTYKGNYTSYEKQREERIARLEAEAAAQQEEIAHMQAFIDKFRYKATKAKQVQDRVKKLEKMERIVVPTRSKKIHFEFPQPPRSGDRVIRFDHVDKAYGDNLVYDGLDYTVYRGQKIALVGPNGAGKSTLLKMIAGVEEPTGGKIELGTNVTISYFAQHQLEDLDPDNTVFEELDKAAPGWTISQVRSLLGAFLFSGSDADKKVSVLSGGEKCRLALAKMLVRPTSLLCLDEPTNHLDISSVQVLADALESFDSTMVLISHDRHLIRTVANRIVHVEDGHLTEYDGGYDYFLEKTEMEDDASSVMRSMKLQDDKGKGGKFVGGGASGKGGQKAGGKGKGSGASGSKSSGKAADGGTGTGSGDGKPEPRRTHTAEGDAKRSEYRTKEQKRADAEARKRRNALVKEDNKRLEQIDADLERLAARKKELTEMMGDESLYADERKSKDVAFEYGDVSKQIDELENEWMEVSERIEYKLSTLDE